MSKQQLEINRIGKQLKGQEWRNEFWSHKQKRSSSFTVASLFSVQHNLYIWVGRILLFFHIADPKSLSSPSLPAHHPASLFSILCLSTLHMLIDVSALPIFLWPSNHSSSWFTFYYYVLSQAVSQGKFLQ